MSVPLVIGGLALGGLALVLYRRATSADPAAYEAGVRCKAARAIAAFYGREISDAQCAAADKVDDAIGVGAIVEFFSGVGKTSTARSDMWRDRDAANKTLNGAIETPLTEQVRGLTSQYSAEAGNPEPLLYGSVLRFKNGGVPFAAHADFGKCAAGTADMTAPGNAPDRFRNLDPSKPFRAGSTLLARLSDTPKSSEAAWSKLGISWANTPHVGQLLRGSSRDPATSVAQSIVAGVLHKCPAGQVLYEVIPVADHREGAVGQSTIIKRCGAPGTKPPASAPPPAAVSKGRSDAYTTPPGTPPPGFRWVLTPAPAHWERNQ